MSDSDPQDRAERLDDDVLDDGTDDASYTPPERPLGLGELAGNDAGPGSLADRALRNARQAAEVPEVAHPLVAPSGSDDTPEEGDPDPDAPAEELAIHIEPEP